MQRLATLSALSSIHPSTKHHHPSNRRRPHSALSLSALVHSRINDHPGAAVAAWPSQLPSRQSCRRTRGRPHCSDGLPPAEATHQAALAPTAVQQKRAAGVACANEKKSLSQTVRSMQLGTVIYQCRREEKASCSRLSPALSREDGAVLKLNVVAVRW